MRLLGRRLFTLCSAASVVLCVAVCVLWVRSRFANDGVGVTWDRVTGSGDRMVTKLAFISGDDVHAGSGGVGVSLTRTLLPAGAVGEGLEFSQLHGSRASLMSDASSGSGGYLIVTEGYREWGRFGIRLVEYREGEHVALLDEGPIVAVRWCVVRAGMLPSWLCAGAAALLGIARARRAARAIRRQIRARKGFCIGCGYDLRATPGCCPECGATEPASVDAGLTRPLAVRYNRRRLLTLHFGRLAAGVRGQ